MADGTTVGGDDECSWDLDEVTQYLGGQTFNLHVLYNKGEFK